MHRSTHTFYRVGSGRFLGVWQPRYHEDQSERIPGPELRDYAGLPINENARQFADSWDPSRITLPEEQCRVHVSPYIYRGPMNLQVWEERDPKTRYLIALKHYISTYEQTRMIYMDGRPHPGPNAPHTWMGFSTGTTRATCSWSRPPTSSRDGCAATALPMSDQAHMTEYYVRNGDLMTQIVVLVDPVFLAEPLVKSQDFVRGVRELAAQTWLWVCEPVIEVPRPDGEVPAYLPGEHPFKDEFARRHGIPLIATDGGPETMYPEFQKVLQAAPKPAPLPLAAAGGGERRCRAAAGRSRAVRSAKCKVRGERNVTRERPLAVAGAIAAGAALAVGTAALAQQQDFSKVEIDAVKVTDSIYMLVGAGGNTTFSSVRKA